MHLLLLQSTVFHQRRIVSTAKAGRIMIYPNTDPAFVLRKIHTPHTGSLYPCPAFQNHIFNSTTLPATTVSPDNPVALATQELPPYPRISASMAARIRRCFSLRTGILLLMFFCRGYYILNYIGGRINTCTNHPKKGYGVI